MRRCTILEGVHQEAKLLLCLFGCEAQNLEHLGLQLGVVNTDGTTTHFDTVAYHVVSISTYSSRVGVEQMNVFVHRVCERMVHRHQTLFLIAPFEHRELCHPQQGELVLVSQTEALAHLQTQFAELLAGLHGIST